MWMKIRLKVSLIIIYGTNMAETFTIPITGIKELLNKLDQVTKENVITSSLDRGAALLVGWSKDNRLSGPRPQYLGVVTERLRSSITFTPTIKEGNTYFSKIGTNVEYAAIHEFGGATGRNHKTIMPARPFLRPALADQDNQKNILNYLTQNINEALAQ